MQHDLAKLKNVIASALAQVKAYDLPKTCSDLDLSPGDGSEAFASKRKYVEKRIGHFSHQELVRLAHRVLQIVPDYYLEEEIWCLESPIPAVSELTRRKLLKELYKESDLTGSLRIPEFFGQIWPLERVVLPALQSRTLNDVIWQNTVRNDDITTGELLELLDIIRLSQKRFFQFLELLVHPTVRLGDDQDRLVSLINKHIERDGFHFVPADVLSGYQVYAISPLGGVSGSPKNLIFAADGPKPEIVISDAINNDIRIVKNEEFCLVFAQPIPPEGLHWEDLVAWWSKLQGQSTSDLEMERALYRRLLKSLASEPERLLFRTYFQNFRSPLGSALPALIPQVYLHYDPYTVRHLGTARIPRQRMDFLLLFAHGQRVVIEIDGQQHYSDGNGTASPKKYAEMAAADRELRLAGYEIYRFGGAELMSGEGEATVATFLNLLFKKHAVGPNSQQTETGNEALE